MKKKYLLSLLCFAFGLSILSSCENLDDLSELGLKPNILAPAFKTEIDVYDFERLLNQNSQYVIDFDKIANELPFTVNTGTPIIFPMDIEIPGKQESQYLSIFDIANRIFLEEAKATLSFTNTFPVALLPDTRFVLRDSANPENIFFNHVIENAVPAGKPYEFKFDRGRDTISSTLEFFVQDVKFGSSDGQLVTFSGDDFVVDLDVEVVDIDKVELKNNISYSDTATQDFEINIDNPADTAAYSGALSIFLTNKYPAEFSLKLELLDDQRNLIYSVFGDSALIVDHAPLDEFGNVIGEVTAEKLDFISVKDINNLDQVTKMRVDVELTTPSDPGDPQFVILDESTSLEMLITADITVDPSKAE